MARNYAAIPHDYLEEMADLNDAEFGRLMRAVLKYSRTGETVALSGNERFLYRRAIMQEDRFQESYKKTSDKNRRNGEQGGRPRENGEKTKYDENPEKATESEKNPSKPNESETSPGEPTESEKKPVKASGTQITQIETETETNTLLPNGRKSKGRSPGGGDVFAEFTGEDAELLQTLQDFEQMRKAIKKPMTDRAKRMLVKKLGGFAPQERIPVLEQSINKCWPDIYELKDQGQSLPAARARAKQEDYQASAERIRQNADWLDNFLGDQGLHEEDQSASQSGLGKEQT